MKAIKLSNRARIKLDAKHRDPNWKPKPQLQIMTLTAFNALFGTRYSQHDADLIAEDLQVSTIAEVPFGRHHMILLDAEEALDRAQLIVDGALNSPGSRDSAQTLQTMLLLQQQEIQRLRKELAEKERNT